MRSAALGPWPCRGLKQEVSAEQSSSRETYPNPNPNPHPNHNPNPNPNPNPNLNPNPNPNQVSQLMQQVPVLRGSADPQQTKLERWSSLAIAPLLGRLQRAGEIAPDANPLTLTLTLTRC